LFSMKAVVPGVSAIIVDNVRKIEKIVMVQREHEPWKGKWVIPGGRIEFGEKIYTALKREVYEETNLRIRILSHVCTFDLIIYNNKQPVYHFIIINYLAYPVGGKLKAGSDASDAKWMSIKEIKDLINKNMAPKILKIPLRKLNLI